VFSKNLYVFHNIAKAVIKNALSQGLTEIQEDGIEGLINQELDDPTY